jgi:hypothetical protein
VRARPSSLKHECKPQGNEHRKRCLADVHAKSCLTPEPLRTLRPETKGQAAACPDRTQAIPCKLRGRLLPVAYAELTATVTATAATNGKRQRPATAHNTHTIRANLGYVRPEKQTVEARSPHGNLASDEEAAGSNPATPGTKPQVT